MDEGKPLTLEVQETNAAPAWVLPVLIATVTAMIIGILILIVVGSELDNQVNENKRISRNTQTSLCSFKKDLIDRNNESKSFLKNNPDIIRKFGLTRSQVEDQQRNRDRTIKSLRVLKCPGP